MGDPETAIVSVKQVFGSSMKLLEETGVIADRTDVAADQQQADVEVLHGNEYKFYSKSVPLEQDREAKTAQGFPFMKLPPELRNMVYKEVLANPGIIDVGELSDCYPRSSLPQIETWGDPPGNTCQLLRASKAIHDEAYPVYFGRNIFACWSFPALRGFLGRLKREYRRSIRSISFDFWGNFAAKTIRLLQGCISLQYLHIDFTRVRLLWDTPTSASVPGLNELMKIRGIRSLHISRRPNYTTHRLGTRTIGPAEIDAYWGKVIEDLQVLEQPRSEAMVRRQDWKEFPLENTKRTVYGRANVQTRSERAIADQDRGKE
ncbi:MAG: hypothetical protein LQ339_005993 [Xanthoria mediterranea]|nr:MAG: hypothetical protein LQ339_005993 [Xanthoria mediterranea]